MTFSGMFTCSTCGVRAIYEGGYCWCLKKKQQKEYAEKTKMQIGEIRKLPKSSSPMFVEQWSVQGTAKAPYIVSRKGGYKGNGYATPEQKAAAWQCSCKNWTTTTPRVPCKHIVAVQLKEKILVMATPNKPLGLHLVPKVGGVVLSKEEHEAYKKFLEVRGNRKVGNSFDEEGRKFRV